MYLALMIFVTEFQRSLEFTFDVDLRVLMSNFVVEIFEFRLNGWRLDQDEIRNRSLSTQLKNFSMFNEQVKIAKELEVLAQLKQQAINLATEIETIGSVILKKKLGENGKIFGTVTSKQIAEEIKARSGGKGALW